MATLARHVVIVGGGVIGLCSAWHCCRAGHRVTLVERHAVRRDGCSYGNAGMVVPSHFVPLAAPGMVALGLKWMWNPESPFYVRPRLDPELFSWGWKFWRACTAGRVARAAPLIRDLSLASRAAFLEMSAASGNAFGLVEKGLLMLCRTEHGFAEEQAGARRAAELGMPAEVLSPGDLARLEPGIRMAVMGAVHYPLDCHLAPDRFMGWLQGDLEAAGVDFRWETEVTGWRTQGRRVTGVETRRGCVEGDEYVVAGGAWTPGIGRDLGLGLPMQAGKGYSLLLTHPRHLPVHCAILTEARVAVTPMGGALRFGGTMELGGLNEAILPVRVQGIIKSAVRYYPDLTPDAFAGVTPWRGLRPCTPDGLPYLGRPGAYDNLVVAAGHAMMGLSLGPVSGRVVCDLVSGREPGLGVGAGIDWSLLLPDRYG